MTISLTDRARARLTEYLDEVRRAAVARGDVDSDDVVAGVREHIDAELAAESPASPVTVRRLDEILERLGTPELWDPATGSGDVVAGGRTWEASGVAGRAFESVWTLVVLALTGILLLGPAVAVWSSAQIGGFLDAWANPGARPIPGTRDLSYWRWVAGLVVGVTAVWWTLLGLAGLRLREGANRLMGPSLVNFSPGSVRILIGCGLALIPLSAWLVLR